MIYDIIIIGAGISGLYSYHLLKKINSKYKLLILESSNRIGGKIYSEGKSILGAKFLHNDIEKFREPEKNNKSYYIGNLQDKSKDIQNSMKLEDSGSISDMIHNKFKYINEINIEYDFNSIVSVLNKNKNIKFNTPFKNYKINNDIIIVNNTYKTKKIIFALPVNVLKNLNTPFKKYFNNWYQSNIITLSFELNGKLNLNDGFHFYDKFKRTSFFYNKQKDILYVNIFDRNNDFSIQDIKEKIVNYFLLTSYKFKYKNWNKDKHLLGGWSIPKKTVNSNIIKLIEGGYNHKIYYTGDYLGKIENMGSATNALNNVETLVSKIYFN